jgi:hypothetical protein
LYKQLAEAFNLLARYNVDVKWLTDYLENVMPDQNNGASTRMSNIREGMKERFESASNSLPGIAGTAWAAYNSVTEYVDHFRSIPKVEHDASRRLESIWMGSGAVIKERALSVALKSIGQDKMPYVKASMLV